MTVEWIKCEDNVWCPLSTVNLQDTHFDSLEGVYIIWHGGANPATVRVGQGVIRDRLLAHRNDPDVQSYSHLDLRVTWASVPKSYRDGVEAFLWESLNPIVGERFPDRKPIEANLPW